MRSFLNRTLLIAVAAASLITVRSWPLASHATADQPRQNEPADSDAETIDENDRNHWSYQPVTRPPLPDVKQQLLVRNEIDQFIVAKLESAGLKPADTGSPRDILRRLYLDLIGLPPSIAEQNDFLKNPTPERLDEEADRLLLRVGYGERWARHWLDLVRYADTNGYERDGTKPEGWRYRDYVIDALNNDKPYDRFIMEQLAGDELDEVTTESLIATSFYRLGPWDDEPADFPQDLHDQRDDIIRTVSQVFLGLTLGCARCHDHKFDALTMRDYYSMSAIVAPLKRPQSGRSELTLPAGSPEQVARVKERVRQTAALEDQVLAILKPVGVQLLKNGKHGLPVEVVKAFTTAPEKRNDNQKKLVSEHESKLNSAIEAALDDRQKRQIAALRSQMAQLKRQVPDLPQGYFLHEPSTDPPLTRILLRGRAATPGDPVEPALPVVLNRKPVAFPKSGLTTRRRLTMAQWIVSPDNPLTARVIVNRVWQYHFGEGLVRTPSDFGVLGEEPKHPKLLDWLAHWFMHDAKWSLKILHRLIVRSNTYRMSNTWNEAAAREDPLNELFWRFPYKRLSVEAIRDSMLAASGRLNRTMYGPGVYLHVPVQALEGHADKTKIWKPFDEDQASRRTIYAFVKRSLVVPMLEVLDLCDTTRSTEKRNITSVPTQALTLFNGDFVNRQARHLAERAETEAGDMLEAQVDRIWQLTLCRPPSDDERQQMVQFLVEEAASLKSDAKKDGKAITDDEAKKRALVQLCRVVFNLNEFVYPN